MEFTSHVGWLRGCILKNEGTVMVRKKRTVWLLKGPYREYAIYTDKDSLDKDLEMIEKGENEDGDRADLYLCERKTEEIFGFKTEIYDAVEFEMDLRWLHHGDYISEAHDHRWLSLKSAEPIISSARPYR